MAVVLVFLAYIPNDYRLGWSRYCGTQTMYDFCESVFDRPNEISSKEHIPDNYTCFLR